MNRSVTYNCSNNCVLNFLFLVFLFYIYICNSDIMILVLFSDTNCTPFSANGMHCINSVINHHITMVRIKKNHGSPSSLFNHCFLHCLYDVMLKSRPASFAHGYQLDILHYEDAKTSQHISISRVLYF
ncbi:hypothetical protein L6164_027121 [Bauhinia variegata]|uniref:Uncharacterized protein n=1 Tax=Bauhinia variegata TaxID=167791 RepID=A0ACB9LT60_BAUVA|nr:hypothetical protein L6164_027121 [Bauhinia variegata]